MMYVSAWVGVLISVFGILNPFSGKWLMSQPLITIRKRAYLQTYPEHLEPQLKLLFQLPSLHPK